MSPEEELEALRGLLSAFESRKIAYGPLNDELSAESRREIEILQQDIEDLEAIIKRRKAGNA